MCTRPSLVPIKSDSEPVVMDDREEVSNKDASGRETSETSKKSKTFH